MENKFTQYKYFKWATRPYGIAREFYYLKSMYDAGMKFFVVIPEKDGIMGSYYFDDPSYTKTLKQMYERIVTNYKSHLGDYQKYKTNILNSSQKLSDSVGKVSDKELFDLYKKYVDSVYLFFDYVFLPFALIEYTEPELSQKFSEEFDIIISSDRPTDYQLMEKAIIDQGSDIAWQDYKWLNSYYIGEEPYSLADIREMKKNIKVEEVNNLFVNLDKNKKRFTEFIKKVKDPQLKAKCILLHEYAYLRNDRVDAWKHSLYLISGFFLYLRKKFDDKVSLKAVANLTYEEIRDILTIDKCLDEKEINKRERNFLYYYDGKINVVTKAEEVAKIKNIVQEQFFAKDKLKGTPAVSGLVRGRVQIIYSNKEIHKVKEGDILVAKATDPRFTPAMRLAKAIVTDEGGMLSHAAITSRELGIPCVVGTKYATEVFKDGDMVEVDANNGIIRKIIK